ncbi:MAG TPA: replication initiator protein A [Candidatus Competibacteraceae bacterium]|nr:replication initiator protein A [Candidatus Competibacteraceae bacterium]
MNKKDGIQRGDEMTDSNKSIDINEIEGQQSTREFFDCDLFNILPYFKDDMASMEHPVFSVSNQLDRRVIHYEHNGNTITIKPGYDGLPTIHDKDILIYVTSYLRAAINQGKAPNRIVRFTAYDFFRAIGRSVSGDSYERFKVALNRLQGVTIHTNVRTGRFRIEKGFGLINSWEAVKEHGGRVIAVEIELSRWLYNAVLSNELLTINPDYFELRKPMERRLYEIARKHCGSQELFRIGLDKLQLKIGTKAPLREFRRSIRESITNNHLPDYEIALSDDDMVTFTSRTKKLHAAIQTCLILLKPETYQKAQAAAPGWDVYALEQQWREWIAKKKEPPKRPDSAFIAFCRKKASCP